MPKDDWRQKDWHALSSSGRPCSSADLLTEALGFTDLAATDAPTTLTALTAAAGRVQAMTFDCYGTLIDWETGMVGALRPLIVSVSTPPVTMAKFAPPCRRARLQRPPRSFPPVVTFMVEHGEEGGSG